MEIEIIFLCESIFFNPSLGIIVSSSVAKQTAYLSIFLRLETDDNIEMWDFSLI